MQAVAVIGDGVQLGSQLQQAIRVAPSTHYILWQGLFPRLGGGLLHDAPSEPKHIPAC